MRILKIESLAPKSEKWINKDIIMLHACFQILKDCVDEAHKHLVYEIRFLYNWWIKRMKREASNGTQI